MKKLMFAAAAVAVAGGAFADPLVYDYKASAKHMYLKEVKVKLPGTTTSLTVYQKVQKTAALKGYLIVDADGATSTTINAAKLANPSYNVGGKWADGNPATGFDYGRNRAFLVVQNSKAEADVRFPKIIPSILDAKWIDTKFAVNITGPGIFERKPATSGLAEGYLYSGGDFGAAARPQLDLLMDAVNKNWAHVTERAAAPANVRMVGDYVWTSLWLFGKYNMPTGLTSLWDDSQSNIEAALTLKNQFLPGDFFFHDAWLNGAGFGKYSQGKVKVPCCGYETAGTFAVLDTLSGNLKGGLLLCTENGTYFSGGVYSHLVGGIWEDQFFCARMGTGRPGDPANGVFSDGTNSGVPDAEPQTDLWQDGELELNTSDCISGSWSIKLNVSKKLSTLAPVTLADVKEGLGANWLGTSLDDDVPGIKTLLSTIKGAAFDLNKNVIFANGDEIYDADGGMLGGLVQQPFMTPAFAEYYGLRNFK